MVIRFEDVPPKRKDEEPKAAKVIEKRKRAPNGTFDRTAYQKL